MYERRMLRLLPLLCCHSVKSFFSRAIFLFLFLYSFFAKRVFFLEFWAKKPPRKPRQENTKQKEAAAKETSKGCDFWSLSLLKLSFTSRSDECASLSLVVLSSLKSFSSLGAFCRALPTFARRTNERTNERMNEWMISKRLSLISSSLIRCVRLKRLSVFCAKDDDDANESLSFSLKKSS